MTLQAYQYVVVRGTVSFVPIPLLLDGKLIPSDGITRCDLVFRREGAADLTISSASPSQLSWFALQKIEVIDGVELPIVSVNLRNIPTPPANGRYKVGVFLWDEESPNGRLWGTIDIEIQAGIPAPAA